MDPRRVAIFACFCVACARTDYRPVDRVLALPGRMPTDAEQARICVADVGERLMGARFSGQMVFAGVPAEVPIDVTLDALDADGVVIAQWVGEDVGAYTEGEAVDCGGDSAAACDSCEATGHLADPGAPSVVIGITLIDG